MTDDDALPAWMDELCRALDVPADLAASRDVLLDVARDAAHHVMRPAAPLTTFLVGYAAAQAVARGADPAVAVNEAATTASALAVLRDAN
jgi:hypothetical protein